MSCDRARHVDQAAFRADPRSPEWQEFRSHYPTCADCAREVASWSAVVAALRDAGGGAAHPDESLLLAFQSEPQRLAATERAALEAHVSGCAQCRSELAVLRSFDFAALAPEPARAAAAAPDERGDSLAERLRSGLTRLAEAIFGVPRPAFALAALVVLALPAAVVSWWVLRAEAPGEPPIAQRMESPQVIAERPAAAPTPEPAPPTPEPLPAPDSPTQVARQAPPSTQPTPEPTPPATAPEPAPRAPVPPVEPAPIPAPAPIQIAALLPGEVPTYRPDLALAGGSFDPVRVVSVVRAGGLVLPRIRALGPEHVGATTDASPTLYWDLEATSEVPVEITLVSETDPEPLLELRLEAPVAAGLHAVSLEELGVRLPPGRPHLWFAALVPDEAHREQDVVAGAGIIHAPPGAGLETELAEAAPASRAHLLAASGYWYDAFATVVGWSEREPEAQRLQEYREALLAQVGLGR